MEVLTSCKFGLTFANRGNPDETALNDNELSHQDFHCLLS